VRWGRQGTRGKIALPGVGKIVLGIPFRLFCPNANIFRPNLEWAQQPSQLRLGERLALLPPFTPGAFFERLECLDESLGEEALGCLGLKDLTDILQQHHADGIVLYLRPRERCKSLLNTLGPLSTRDLGNRTQGPPVIGRAIMDLVRDEWIESP
jgi:hypothetical protein